MFNLSKIFVSFFGIGLISKAPGTLGSLIFVIIFYLTYNIIPLKILIGIFFLIFFLSLFMIKIYANRIKIIDSSEIIIDEFLGINLIIIFIKYLNYNNDKLLFILIFLIFRFFDILKIYPANLIDKKIKNPLGVILDDIVAAIYSLMTIFLIYAFI